jgi:lysozyme family protein
MARIPIYQERQQASQAFAAPDLRAPDVGGGAIGRGLQQVGQGLQNLAVGQLRLDTENGKAQAAKIFGETQNEFVSLLQSEKENAPAGAKDFTGNFTTKLKDYRDKVLAQQTDPFAKKFLESSINQLGVTLSRDALMFEATEGRRQRIDDVKTSIDEIATSIRKQPDPVLVKQSFGTIQAQIDSMQATPEEKRRLTEYNQTQLARAYVGTTAINNPRALIGMAGNRVDGVNLSPSNVREATINFILDAEGSEYVADDAGAGEAKYGIVAKFNPGVDVKNLTKEQAAQIYRERYWNSVNADSLPPALAAVMTDTAVNMGAGKAKELLEKSGGDIGSFLELRREHYRNLATSDPKKYGQFLNGWMNRVNRLEAFANSASTTEVKTVDLTKSPQNNPASENIIDWLPLNEQLSYVKQAQTVIKQDQALVQKQFQERISNANAMAVDGIQDPKPLTSADFFKAFEPQEAVKQLASYQENQKLAATMSDFKTSSSAEINQALSMWKPEPGEDYAIAEKRFNILQQAAARITEQRKKDPVAYVANTNPRIAELQESISSTYTATGSADQRARLTQEYATAVLAEQERLGIIDSKVLSQPEVDFLTRRIGAGNETSADIVASLEQQYGREFFPRVMSELMQKGKLPPAMMIIPDLESPIAREIVARVSTIKTDDLKAGIADKAFVRDVTEKVAVEVAKLRTSAGNLTGQSAAQIDAYSDIMTKIALEGYGRSYTSSKEAVNAASEMLIGKYQFTNGDTLRLPVQVDARKVRNGLNDRIPEIMKTLSDSDIPPDRTGARTLQERRASWESTVRSKPVWIADGETKGAHLYAKMANNQLVPVLQNGEKIYVTWEQATAKSAEQSIRLREVIGEGELPLEQMPGAQERGVGIIR